MLVRVLLPSLWLLFVCSTAIAQTKGRLIVTMEDAGGNAAPYGYVSVEGPEEKRQSLSCPRASLGSNPSGRVSCDTFYGSSFLDEWQPFDIITARVVDESQTTIPDNVRPSDVTSCVWKFEGFTGACTGMGTRDPDVTNRIVWECQFVLPERGDINLGVRVSGFDNLNRPCPKLDDPFGPPAPPTISPTPDTPDSPDTAPGTEIVKLINEIAGDILDGMRDQKIRRVVEKVVAKKLGPTFDQIVFQVTGVAGSRSRVRSLRMKKKRCPRKVARGKVTTSTTEDSTLRVRFTKRGKACLRNKKKANINFSFTATQVGQVGALASTSDTLKVRKRKTK